MEREDVGAAILDVDGTLIDSNDQHAHAWMDAGAELGYDIAFDHVRPLIGMGGDRVTPRLIGEDEDSDTGRRIRDLRGEIFREHYLPSLGPTRGARELLERMRAEGLELVVATSASEEDMNPLLEQAGIRDLIEEKTSSDDAEDSKPAPDIVQAALERSPFGAERAVMLGDTPYDVEACRRAGIPCVALRCGGWWSDVDFEGAAAIYDDPADLLAHWDESPFGRLARGERHPT